MQADAPVDVEVVYATPEQQRLIELRLPAGSTARDAVLRSGLDRFFPGLDLSQGTLGIFGRVVDENTELRTGDRVEIYRALRHDPREARREKAAQGARPAPAGNRRR